MTMGGARSHTIVLHALFGAVLFAAYALAEELLWSRYSVGIHPYIWARAGLGAFVGGLGCSAVGGLSAAAVTHPRIGTVLGAVAIAATFGLAGFHIIQTQDIVAAVALMSVAGLAALVLRRVGPTRTQIATAIARIGPYAMSGLFVAFAAAAIEYAPARADRAAGLMKLLTLVWSGATIAAFVYALTFADRRARWTTIALPVVGLAAIVWLPGWFFALMVALKICALVFVVLIVCLVSHSAVAPPTLLNRLVTVLASWGAISTMVLFALDVPNRFGPVDVYSLVGAVLVPLTTDSDDDSFFALDIGGTDPDDGDAASQPIDVLARFTGPGPVGAQTPIATHVIVVIADAMRSDATYGQSDLFINSPEFVRFDRAYSPSNTTNISLPKLLDGTAPRAPGASGSRLFDAIPPRFEPEFGVFTDLEQDWDPARFGVAASQFHLHNMPEPRSSFAGATLAWLEQRHTADGPGRVSVSYFSDPHAPHFCADGSQGGYECYLDEIRGVDRFVVSLVDHLEKSGLKDRTLLIVTADHGEEFGEHGFDNHSTNLFDVQLRVPLALRIPGVAGRVVHTPVSNAGIGATLLEAIGGATPNWFYGSLLPLARGDATSYPVPIAHHWEDDAHDVRVSIRKTAFIEDARKLVVDWRTARVDLYDPTRDDAPVSEATERARLVELYLGNPQWAQ